MRGNVVKAIHIIHTGSNPVLTTKNEDMNIDNLLNYGIYPLCAMMAVIALWGIAIELEKIRKK